MASATPIPDEVQSADTLPEQEASPLIVLDERQLEEPIEAAIRRIREDPAQQGSRILVIGRDVEVEESSSATIYPHAPGRSRRWFLRADPGSEHLAGQVDEAIQRTGRSWRDAQEILTRWFAEHRGLTAELEENLAARDLDRLATGVARLRDLELWIGESLGESLQRAERACQGKELLCTVDLIRNAARRFHDQAADIDLLMPPLNRVQRVEGQASALQKVFLDVLELIAQRIGNSGKIRIQVEGGEAFVLHRFEGTPCDRDTGYGQPSRHGIEQIRHVIQTVHRGRIRPSGQSGLVIALPSPRIGFLLDS